MKFGAVPNIKPCRRTKFCLLLLNKRKTKMTPSLIASCVYCFDFCRCHVSRLSLSASSKLKHLVFGGLPIFLIPVSYV